MIRKSYAFFYAIYSWSERIFFLALALLVIIPFTTFENRTPIWITLLLFTVFLPVFARIAEFVCRSMLATRKKRSPALQRHVNTAALLDEQDERERLAAIARQQAAIEAETRRAAIAEQQHRLETAWWVNRQRF